MVGKLEAPAHAAKTPATPDHILAAATRLFAERGFDGTSLQDIADAVGLRKPSLLYHFESKDELRRAVLESLLSRWNDVLPRLLLAASSGKDQFAALVDESVGFFTADPDRARLLLREVLDRPADVRVLITAHVTPWVEVVASYMRKGIGHGEIHAEVDPEAYVIAVINLILSSFATTACLGATVSRERHVAELLRIARTSLFTASHTMGAASDPER